MKPVLTGELHYSCGSANVFVTLENSKVVGTTLMWLTRKAWTRVTLPGGRAQLEDLHTAIGDMLDKVKDLQGGE